MSHHNITQDNSIHMDTMEDEILLLSSEDSEDESDGMNDRLRIASESSDSNSSIETQEDEESFDDVFSNLTFTKRTNVFFETPGPKCDLGSNKKPIDYFSLFFTPMLLRSIVKETNQYAAQFLDSRNFKANSRLKKWTPTCVIEIKAFIAVLLEMGITRRASICSFWNRDSRYIPWFGKMFSRDRFQLLVRFFNLVDNRTLAPPGHPNYDPCARFDMLVEHANSVFGEHYIPHQQLIIDESLFGSHSSSKECFPNSNIKFWTLCDSVTKYCLAFYYRKGGKQSVDKNFIRKHGLGFTVVQKLLSIGNYLNKGYHLFINHFYTSFYLVRSLLQNNTFVTGTIRHNRVEVPVDAKKVKVGKAQYFSNGEVLMCSYKEKKSETNPTIVVSSNADFGNVTIIRKIGKCEMEKEKPSVIHDYNSHIGRHEESDEMLYVYLNERRSLKYWKKIAFNIFGKMVLNAYILYVSNTTDKKMTRLQFTSQIIENIEKEWLAYRNVKAVEATDSSMNKKFELEKLPGRMLRRCVVCSNNKTGIKRTNLICVRCKKGLHGICAGKHDC